MKTKEDLMHEIASRRRLSWYAFQSLFFEVWFWILFIRDLTSESSEISNFTIIIALFAIHTGLNYSIRKFAPKTP